MFMFPWGDFHSLNLGWFLEKFNELRKDWATAEAGIDGALDAEIQKAEDALSDVFAARDAAAASASAANSSALNASQSSIASMDARDQSRAARDAAQQAALNATGSETAAGQSARAAAASETAAGRSETAAGQSATAAGQSATAAGQSATNAAASETAAGNSATAAEASAQRAEDIKESIPEDYTTLSNDVANLKTALANINGAEYTATEIMLTQLAAINQTSFPIVNNGITFSLVDGKINISGTATGRIITTNIIARGIRTEIGHKYLFLLNRDISPLAIRIAAGTEPTYSRSSFIATATASGTDMYITIDSMIDITGQTLNITGLSIYIFDLTALNLENVNIEVFESVFTKYGTLNQELTINVPMFNAINEIWNKLNSLQATIIENIGG